MEEITLGKISFNFKLDKPYTRHKSDTCSGDIICEVTLEVGSHKRKKVVFQICNIAFVLRTNRSLNCIRHQFLCELIVLWCGVSVLQHRRPPQLKNKSYDSLTNAKHNNIAKENMHASCLEP